MRIRVFSLVALAALITTGCRSSALGRSVQGVFPTQQTAGPRAAVCVPARVPEGGMMPVDLPSVIRLASKGNIDVQLVRERVREAHARALQAGQWYLPVVRPAIRYQRVDGLVQGTEGNIVDVGKENVFAGAGVFLKWELGEGPYQELAAQQRSQASRAAWRAEQTGQVSRAAEAYMDLLQAQSGQAIAEQSVALYETFVAETQSKVDVGGGFEGDVLRARANLSHAQVQQSRAQGRARVAAAALRELVGLPRCVQLHATEPQPVPLSLVPEGMNEEALICQAIAGRAELREARLHASAARAEQRAALSGTYMPDVTLGYEGGLFGDRLDGMDGTSRFGVGLGWDIGPGGIGDKSRQVVATSRYQQYRIKAARMEQQIVREVSTSVAEYESRAISMTQAQAGVTDAERALHLYQEREKLGVGIPLDVILATETLTRARTDYLEAVAGYNKAQIRLLAAMGRMPR